MFSIHSCPLGQLGSRDTGGMNVYVRELARQLGHMGYRVDIFTRAHDPRDAQMECPSPGVRLIHIRAGAIEDMGKMAQYEHLADFTDNMAAFLGHDGARYDLVHSHYWLSGVAGGRFARQWGVPHLIMFHTLGAIKNRLPVGEIEPQVRLEAEEELINSCQRIITATDREKSDLARLYDSSPDKVSVIPCGVNMELFQPRDRVAARRELGIDLDDKVVLAIGRIEPLKGLDRLIGAMSFLKHWPRLRLLVVGGDENSRPEVERLKALAGESGVSVEFLGTMPQKRLPLYYSAADVLVVASYYESFCLVVLESLACGTPVVSTAVGIAPSVVRQGENGYLVADNTPEKLAEGIDSLFASEASDETCSQAIRDSVAGYGWPAVARLVAREYESVLAASLASLEVGP